jgi:hypothetical protein
MQRLIRAAACCALVSSLAACVVTPPQASAPPPPPPGPNPREVAMHRMEEVNMRIDNLSHRIDARVSQGFYPPPEGGRLHHRLDTIRQEAHDMAAARGGYGISGDEQHVLNQELDGAARAIGG